MLFPLNDLTLVTMGAREKLLEVSSQTFLGRTEYSGCSYHSFDLHQHQPRFDLRLGKNKEHKLIVDQHFQNKFESDGPRQFLLALHTNNMPTLQWCHKTYRDNVRPPIQLRWSNHQVQFRLSLEEVLLFQVFPGQIWRRDTCVYRVTSQTVQMYDVGVPPNLSALETWFGRDLPLHSWFVPNHWRDQKPLLEPRIPRFQLTHRNAK